MSPLRTPQHPRSYPSPVRSLFYPPRGDESPKVAGLLDRVIGVDEILAPDVFTLDIVIEFPHVGNLVTGFLGQ